MNITKEKFSKYLFVQIEGKVNMLSYQAVSVLSGLSIEEIKEIQKNYNKYSAQWPKLRDGVEQIIFARIKADIEN